MHAFGPEVIERQLDHCERNAIKAAYNRATHLDARKDLMQWYSDFLDGKVASRDGHRALGKTDRAAGFIRYVAPQDGSQWAKASIPRGRPVRIMGLHGFFLAKNNTGQTKRA